MNPVEYRWQVAADHPALAGHFPGQPIVPGVVLLDQAILFAEQFLGRPVSRWQIGNAKFLSPAAPLDSLAFSLQLKPSGAIAVHVSTAGRTVASASLTPAA